MALQHCEQSLYLVLNPCTSPNQYSSGSFLDYVRASGLVKEQLKNSVHEKKLKRKKKKEERKSAKAYLACSVPSLTALMVPGPSTALMVPEPCAILMVPDPCAALMVPETSLSEL